MYTHVTLRTPPLLALLLLGFAAPAQAEVKHLTYRVGPIDVAGYEVQQQQLSTAIPKPPEDGFVTHMKVDLVDAKGRPIPIQRLMLHHIVFLNLGTQIGAKRDATCNTFTALDSASVIPALAERFYAAGEERAELALPEGYGYRTAAADQWALTWMVMNHRKADDRAYIRYDITYDTSPALKPATPVWLDVRNCRMDPVYDVPGGGAPGSTDAQTAEWIAPEAGRLIAAGGHVHGGGKELRLSQPACGDRTLARMKPTWGARSHPFYNVKPVLHEPGPVNMSAFTTGAGFPLAAGEKLKLTSIYDARRPHTRVMGIVGAFFAADASQSTSPDCGELPGDVRTSTPPRGRAAPPKVTVPLTGLDARGRAVRIKAPPGALKRAAGDAGVRVRDARFGTRNLSVPRGATVRWSFTGALLHDVTVASGPRGFSSPHYGRGGRFEQTLGVPGTYRIFCSLHPVAMTQRIVVR